VPRPARLTRRGRGTLRVVALFLLLAGIACAVVAVQPEESEAAAPLPGEPATRSLLSPRRLPNVFVGEVANARLQSNLDAFIAPYNACLTVDTPSGVRLAATPDGPRIPASTLKMVTGLAALEELGPDHRFVTRVVGDGGELALVGGGDPVLTTPDYEAALRESLRTTADVITPLAELADEIVAAGIDEVAQLTIVDDPDAVRFLPQWKPGYAEDVGQLGTLTVDDGFDRGTRVSDPGVFAGQQLAELLSARGVEVGGVARGTADPDAPEIASVESPPLNQIVASMLSSSDNLSAELLLRALTPEGTTPAGANRAFEILQALGIPTEGVVLSDGSGLARDNRLTCATLMAALEFGKKYPALFEGLSIAGVSGTLASRFASDDPLTGVLHAKTGYLDDVAGLAGYVDDPEDLRFTFILNHDMSTAAGRQLQAQAAAIVAAYPDAPAAEELVPAP
jgi:D-alanyl-D-alanine carboxypeptidase/D-alanyl-D-alanine-endopeptidase (penicillin-binding protein 4)